MCDNPVYANPDEPGVNTAHLWSKVKYDIGNSSIGLKQLDITYETTYDFKNQQSKKLKWDAEVYDIST